MEAQMALRQNLPRKILFPCSLITCAGCTHFCSAEVHAGSVAVGGAFRLTGLLGTGLLWTCLVDLCDTCCGTNESNAPTHDSHPVQ